MADEYLSHLLGEREKILLVTHQHWFLLLRNILFEILLIIATIIAVVLINLFLCLGARLLRSVCCCF